MTMWCSIHGTVTAKPCNQVMDLIDQLDDLIGCEINTDGPIVIEFDCGDDVPNCSIGDIHHVLHELGNYVIEPAMLEIWHDDEQSTFYVGPPEREPEFRSIEALENIRDLLHKLQEREIEALVKMLQDPKTWMKETRP